MTQLNDTATGSASEALEEMLRHFYELNTGLEEVKRSMASSTKSSATALNGLTAGALLAAKSASSVTSALRSTATALKAVRSLLDFDEINRLTAPSSSGSGKSGTSQAAAADEKLTAADLGITEEMVRQQTVDFWRLFTAGVKRESQNSTLGNDLVDIVSHKITGAISSGREWIYDHIINPFQEAWESIGNFPLGIPLFLATKAGDLWQSFKEDWGTRAVSIVNTLLTGAGTLWQNFKTAWGTRTVSITNGLLSSAAALWSAFKEAWGTRKVGITNGLLSSAATLWSAFQKAWGTRKVSISNTLANTAATLWSKFKAGWSGKTLSLKITYNTDVGTIKKAVYKALGLPGWPTISFAARGGVVDAATLFGSTVVGEAGAEAILPLERNTGWMNYLAEQLADRMGGAGAQSITVNVTLDGQVVGRSVVKYVNGEARRTGVNPLAAAL